MKESSGPGSVCDATQRSVGLITLVSFVRISADHGYGQILIVFDSYCK